MANDSMKLHNSPWRSHRTSNTTVSSSPRLESPIALAQRRKSSGRSSSFSGHIDSLLLDVPVDYHKQASSPISDEELRLRKDVMHKTYQTSLKKDKYFEVLKGNRTKRNVSSKSTDHRRRQVPANPRGKKAVGFDEYDFPFLEDEVFETGGKNGGRMTLREFGEARKLEKLNKTRKGSEKSKQPQTPNELRKKRKKSLGGNSSSEHEKTIFKSEVPNKPSVKSVKVVNFSLNNIKLGKQGRP